MRIDRDTYIVYDVQYTVLNLRQLCLCVLV